MTEPDLTTSCVVIGAGQAGLSVAYYLKRLGLEAGQEFVLLDRGPSTGGAWQFRWEALRLGSAHRVNDLPGMDELGLSFATAEEAAAYAARYGIAARVHAVPPRRLKFQTYADNFR